MIARGATSADPSVVDLQLDKLAGCDESLSAIASDVSSLVDQLVLLRAETDALAEHRAEQDALLADRELALSELEAERSRARLRADELAAALQEAEVRLALHDGRAARADSELQELRDALDDRNRLVTDIQDELRAVRETLAERDAILRHDRGGSARIAAGAGFAATAARRQGHQEPDVGREAATKGHVRFAPFPEGYRLIVSDEGCSRPGDLIEVGDSGFVVTRVGRSPLPDDDRPCAFLVPARS